MRIILFGALFLFIFVFVLSYYIDMEITRREYLSRADLRDEISGCRFDRNCRHYNKLLKHTEYNTEELEEE